MRAQGTAETEESRDCKMLDQILSQPTSRCKETARGTFLSLGTSAVLKTKSQNSNPHLILPEMMVNSN